MKDLVVVCTESKKVANIFNSLKNLRQFKIVTPQELLNMIEFVKVVILDVDNECDIENYILEKDVQILYTSMLFRHLRSFWKMDKPLISLHNPKIAVYNVYKLICASRKMKSILVCTDQYAESVKIFSDLYPQNIVDCVSSLSDNQSFSIYDHVVLMTAEIVDISKLSYKSVIVIPQIDLQEYFELGGHQEVANLLDSFIY